MYERMSQSHPRIVTSCKDIKTFQADFRNSEAQIIRGWVCKRVIRLEDIQKRSNDLG